MNRGALTILSLFRPKLFSKASIFNARKFSNVAPQRKTCLRTHIWEDRKIKSPGPGVVEPHDLWIMRQASALPLCYNRCLNTKNRHEDCSHIFNYYEKRHYEIRGCDKDIVPAATINHINGCKFLPLLKIW